MRPQLYNLGPCAKTKDLDLPLVVEAKRLISRHPKNAVISWKLFYDSDHSLN